MTWWRSLNPEDRITVVFCTGCILMLLMLDVSMIMMLRGV